VVRLIFYASVPTVIDPGTSAECLIMRSGCSGRKGHDVLESAASFRSRRGPTRQRSSCVRALARAWSDIIGG